MIDTLDPDEGAEWYQEEMLAREWHTKNEEIKFLEDVVARLQERINQLKKEVQL